MRKSNQGAAAPRYPLTYTVQKHEPPLTSEQVREQPDRGACDAVILLSIMYADDGGYSCAPLSMDGRSRERKQLPDVELWKAWAMLAYSLSRSEDLAGWQHDLCLAVHRSVKDWILEASNASQPEAAPKRESETPDV